MGRTLVLESPQRRPRTAVLSTPTFAMGSDPPSQDAASLSASQASSAQESCLLVMTALASWPEAVARQLAHRPPLRVDELSDEAFAASGLVLLGYTDPAQGLAERLRSQDELQVLAPLEQWRLDCQRMLELRRRRPHGCLLINLSRLDAAAEAALFRLAGQADGSAPEPEAASSPPPLPTVVAFHLSHRSDLNQLYADLEGCAELLGREPEFAVGQPFAPARGLALSEQLMGEWLEQRRQQFRSEADLLTEIAAGRQERDRLQAELAALHQEITTLQTTQQECEQQRRRAEEAEARLSDALDNHELTMLQKQQLEEELSHSFQEQQQSRRRTQEMAERLATLEHECRHLFLNGHLGEGTDRNQIPMVLDLMRRSLLP